MKKTIKIVALLALIALFATGCSMKSNVGLTISKDKKVTVKMISAMDDEMIDYYLGMANGDSSEGKTYTDAERWEFLESGDSSIQSPGEGYTMEKYDQDGFKGYVFTLELGTLDDLCTTDKNATATFDELNKDSKIFVKNGDKYSLNINGSSDEDIEQAKSYEEYGAAFDLKFFVTLPNPAISNNATTVSDDKLTYTWDLLSAKDFQLEFKVNNSNNTALIICIIAAVVVICAIVAAVLAKKGKGDKVESAPVEPEKPVDTPVEAEEVEEADEAEDTDNKEE